MSGDSDFALYGYFRSSAAFRVRIALNLKSIEAEPHFLHLRKDQHLSESYRAVNPQALVPALVHDGKTIAQSLAIIEYLDELRPDPPLLPRDAGGRARVRQIALSIACDIHPLNNLRVLRHLRHALNADEQALNAWQQHWIVTGFDALETFLRNSGDTGRFCHGDSPTLADICLIPQMTNARRIQMELAAWPTLLRIEEAAYRLPAFVQARPENQPDAE